MSSEDGGGKEGNVSGLPARRVVDKVKKVTRLVEPAEKFDLVETMRNETEVKHTHCEKRTTACETCGKLGHRTNQCFVKQL